MGKKGKNEDLDELEDALDDDEEEAAGSKKRKNPFVDDAADEDDEEDDDDDGPSKRKKKRSGAARFFDDIADVDDDEEEEEEDADEEDLIDDREEFTNQANLREHASLHRQMHREREREEENEEDIARRYEERVQEHEEGAYDDSFLAQAGAVGQQAMQPTLNDPKLWLVTCRPGHEREAVTQLLQKYYAMHDQRTPLLIKSAVTLDHLKGYIYVEADKESHVRDAIKGLRTIFVSKGVKLVPLDQMVDAITVNRKAKAAIAPGNWVRVRNGLYKDDLGKVDDVDYASQKATILLVPRMDLQAMAERATDKEARKKNPFGRTAVRPPSKPFNVEEARQLNLLVNRVQKITGQWVLQLGTYRFVNGYVERDIAFKNLVVIEGVPPLEELQRFNACGAAADDGRGGLGQTAGGSDLSSLVNELPNGGAMPKIHFLKDDLVTIVQGELKGIEAVVDSVRDDGKVMVRPKVDGFNDVVDFDNEDLRKVFRAGDHVRVVTGPYAGEIGIVLQVVPANDQCIIISDATRQELRTFGRDMTTTDVTNTGVEVLGEYQLHDLVQLDQNTAGVIIQIQRQSARVLTSASSPEQADIRIVKAADMQRKLKARNLLTSDMHNNQVRAGDYVSFVVAGKASKQQQQGGSVEYVWRGLLFLKGKEFLDTGGFLCVRAKQCKVRGGATTNIDLARQVAYGQVAPRSTPRESPGGGRASFQYMPASPSQYTQPSSNNNRPGDMRGGMGGGGPGGFRPPPPRPGASGGGFGGGFSGARHAATSMSQLVGKTVRVVGGQYNGYKGRVKHETGTHAQLELDAISGRIVTVDKRFIRDEAAVGGRGPPGPAPRAHPGGYGSGGGYEGGYSGSVGAYGSRTPLHPSQTPLHPSMTPAHYSMSATPLHAPYTPAHAPTPSDDNAYMLGDHHHDDRPYQTARTPGMAQAYTPNAYTPAAAPTPSMYPADGHTAPTPALDAGPEDEDGPPLMADTPGLAPTPNLPAAAAAPTPYLPATTPAITPGDLHAPTPAMPMDGLLGATPGLAPTPHADHMHMYTPNIAATPQLPGVAATPGPSGPALEEPQNYHQWVGLVVQVAGRGGDPGSWPQAVVTSVEPDGQLHVVRGSFPQPEGPCQFQEEPGAQPELLHGSQVVLLRPGKKDRVKVLNAEAHAQAHVGSVGTIMGVDVDGECIVKIDAAGQMCVVHIKHLGKLAHPV